MEQVRPLARVRLFVRCWAKWKNYPGKAWTDGTSGCDPSIMFVLLTTLRQLGGWACERGVRRHVLRRLYLDAVRVSPGSSTDWGVLTLIQVLARLGGTSVFGTCTTLTLAWTLVRL